MALLHRIPAPPLADFVHAIFLFEGEPQPHTRERALPDGSVQILFNLHEDRTRVYDRERFDLCQTFNGSLIVGPQTEFCVIDPSELLSVAGVHFKPGGAAAFLPIPMHELQGTHAPLDVLWGNLASELRDRLIETADASRRLDLLEQALLASALRSYRRGRLLEINPAVQFSLDHFARRSGESMPLAQVIHRTGFSQRHFIDLFRREVGLTPKLFCRVLRFKQTLQCISMAEHIDWTAVSLEAGYFDQAHFNHDFRAFSGINPSSYQKARRQFANHVPIE